MELPAVTNMLDHFRGKARFDRDVGRCTDDFLPRRAQNEMGGFRIEPEVELVPGIVGKLRILALWIETAAHEYQLLSQLRKLRIDGNGERQDLSLDRLHRWLFRLDICAPCE